MTFYIRTGIEFGRACTRRIARVIIHGLIDGSARWMSMSPYNQTLGFL